MSKESHRNTVPEYPICEGNTCILGPNSFITAYNLSLSYRSKPAFENVRFETDACSLTAIIGPSGCGKSSFLSCFNRLSDMIPGCQVDGSIKIGEMEIFSKDTDVLSLRRQVGMIFQKPNPFPISIYKNLALPLKKHGIKRKGEIEAIVERCLGDVGLWDEVKDRLHSPAQALSGGQQQRLCMARALTLQPNVILLDEPCSALDPVSSTIVEEHIKNLKSRYTILMVTHNLAQAKRLADRTAFFWTKDGVGRLVESGPANEIFTNPKHELTAAYISGQCG